MRETEFIKQNKEKWQEFERILNNSDSHPEDLSRVFIESTDDLSYARTRYKNRSVRVYLNGIAQRIYQQIYSRTREKNKQSFWRITAPSIIYKSRREMLVATIVFLFSVAIGVFSAYNDPNFSSIMLGESYVEMTEANIESGDPMAVYKQMDPLDMFLKIATNNIRVSFIVFVLGVFFSLGTLMGLLYNGAMVGAFLYFFIERDLFQESFLTIMLHGTLELSCIALAGAAGLTLGRGLLFPGTYSRMQAFLISARKGITIMISIVPFLVIAAAIESYATRITEAPDIIRLLIILISLAIVIGYYVILPRRVVSRGLGYDIEDELQEDRSEPLEYDKIKGNGKVFSDGIVLFRQKIRSVLQIALGGSVISIILFGFHNDWSYSTSIESDYYLGDLGGLEAAIANLFWFPDDIAYLFNYASNWSLILSSSAVYTSLMYLAIRAVRKLRPDSEPLDRKKTLIALSISNLVLCILFALPTSLLLLIGFTVLPVLVYLPIASVLEGSNMPDWSKGRKFGAKRFMSIYGLLGMLSLFQFMVMFLINAPVSYLIFDFILSNFLPEWELAKEVPFVLYGVLSLFILYSFSFLIFICYALHVGSSRELLEANSLRMQINDFGTPKTYYGIEREEL